MADTIKLGETYRAVEALLDEYGYKDVGYVLKVEQWNHRHGPQPPDCILVVVWKPRGPYCFQTGPTFDLVVERLRLELEVRRRADATPPDPATVAVEVG